MSQSQNRVVYGTKELTADLSGKTVGWVRSSLAATFNIAPEAAGHVGDSTVSDGYTLQAGDELEFIKVSGTNG